MTATAPAGPVSETDHVPDEALRALRAHASTWVATGPAERVRLLEQVLADTVDVADAWVKACISAEGLDPRDPSSGEEAMVGPYILLRDVRLLRDSIRDIERRGAPRIAGPVRTRPDGQVTARVFPVSAYDRLFYRGISADVWMEPGVTAEDLATTQAIAYRRDASTAGGICLVLAAGNVSSIGPLDILTKLFIENRVVIAKLHPANSYLRPIFERALRPLVDLGVVRFIEGDAAVGAALCRHPEVDDVHMTGSIRTYDAIVFGSGPEGEARQQRGEAVFHKPVTAELGNVSPVIVVPGRWSSADLARQAENVATMLTNNGGFNCNAARVIITHADWPQRDAFLAAIRDRLGRTPTRDAYYPGAADRFDAFAAAHPEMRQMGQRTGRSAPLGARRRRRSGALRRHLFHDRSLLLHRRRNGLGRRVDRRLRRPRRHVRQRDVVGDAQRHGDRPPSNAARAGGRRRGRAGAR